MAVGPVIGWVSGRGRSTGWEAGGGPMSARGAGGDPVVTTASLFTHFNVGMSWRPPRLGEDSRERVVYVVWEPWFLLGGTLGLRESSSDGVRPLVGAWEAVPFVFGAGGRHSFPLTTCSPCATLSLAFGWRFDGGGEFYLAPKVGLLNGMTMPFPFQTYAD